MGTELETNSRLRPQKKVSPLSFLSLDYLPSSGRLSSPGHKSFFSTFFCVQNHRTRWGRCALTGRIFEPKKDRKRPNLGGQAGDTLTHLKALIMIHNTSKKKNGACHLSGPANRPVGAIDRRPGERNFFFQARPGAGRGSLSQARGGRLGGL